LPSFLDTDAKYSNTWPADPPPRGSAEVEALWLLGDAKSSLGDAKSSLIDAQKSAVKGFCRATRSNQR
jgi:hypothetical protein